MDGLDADIRHMLDAEESGRERRGNHLRLSIVGLFLAMFAVFYLKSEQHYPAAYVILLDFACLLAYGLFLELLLRKGRYHHGLKYASFAADLTCVSVLVVSSLFVSRGPDPTGWVTTIAVYFLFIVLTGLRFTPRLCLAMGVFAAIDFTLVNRLAQAVGGGGLPLPQEATIAVLMIAAGIVLAISVRSARRLVIRMGMVERERAHLEGVAEATKRLAMTDELTGLHNRRFFQEELERELLRAKRNLRSLAVLVIDVDNFKDVNDRLGHLAGDEVLRQITALLRQHTRSSDVVARLGGDEFGMMLLEVDATRAEALAVRLCEALRNHRFDMVGDLAGLRPTMSIGLACFPQDGRDMNSLLTAADKGMYAAKSSGKDQVKYATT